MIAILLTATLGQLPPDDAFFEAKIRPVLAESCFQCHGPKKANNGLRLDSREAMMKGGDSGPAMVPGSPEKSLLLQAIRHANKDLQMPPKKKLPGHVAADFQRWIKQGAPWPRESIASEKQPDPGKHWAIQPVKPVGAPVDSTGWASHPIDRFLAAGWRVHGLNPVGPADPRTLIRRMTFDLHGLPPTPDEVEAFVREYPGAKQQVIANLVDRLLASPRYGERWGRHWMDVVRYADTAGDNADYPIPEIYRYRDYIIDSFNADKPFDEFIREQIAGDILARQGSPEKYAERIVATGFLALARRYATAPYEFWHLSLEDVIDTTGQAFLGLTMRCARCHDHKFDPIVKEDYYGLYGIFAATAFPFAGAEEFHSMNRPREKFVPLVPDGGKEKLAKHQLLLKQLADDIKKLEKELAALPKEKKDERNPLEDKLIALKREHKTLFRLGLPPDVPGAYAVQDGKPVETRIHLQGNPDKPGAVAPRRVIKFIEGQSVSFPPDGSGRLELAKWITRPDNPLTARVLANRVWQYHFGQGIVPTSNNFGLRGEPPSHPELLDHLAIELVKSGWSLKKLHRHIMLSKAYQLASTTDEGNAAKDPGNRWRWRFDRRRLDAEALRDSMLFVGGKLNLKRPGPHPFPPITAWNWTQHNPFKEIYPSNHRSVFLMTPRIQRHPYLALFDGPDTNASAERRTSSIVPLQALYLMNHPFVKEQAEGLASRLLAVAQTERIPLAYQLSYGRSPSAAEEEKGLAYFARYIPELQSAGAPANRVEIEAWTSYVRILLTANEFVFVD